MGMGRLPQCQSSGNHQLILVCVRTPKFQCQVEKGMGWLPHGQPTLDLGQDLVSRHAIKYGPAATSH